MISEIELQTASGIIAVACKSSDGAAVQIGLSELGAKPIQIPSGEGSPSEMIASAKSKVAELESSITSCEDKLDSWGKSNGRDLVILLEHLEREESIYTAPTLLAVSNQAFVLDGWVPTSDKNTVQKALEAQASHVSIEKYEAPHHGHGHDEEGTPDSDEVPKELIMLSDYLAEKNISVFQFFRSMDLDDSGELEFREIESAMKKADIPDMPPLNLSLIHI